MAIYEKDNWPQLKRERATLREKGWPGKQEAKGVMQEEEKDPLTWLTQILRTVIRSLPGLSLEAPPTW